MKATGWQQAKKWLPDDEDNLAGFCEFLGTEAGKPLRTDGLQWIADAIAAKPDLGKWYREETSGAFMEFLDVLVSDDAAVAQLSRPAKRCWTLVRTPCHGSKRRRCR